MHSNTLTNAVTVWAKGLFNAMTSSKLSLLWCQLLRLKSVTSEPEASLVVI